MPKHQSSSTTATAVHRAAVGPAAAMRSRRAAFGSELRFHAAPSVDAGSGVRLASLVCERAARGYR